MLGLNWSRIGTFFLKRAKFGSGLILVCMGLITAEFCLLGQPENGKFFKTIIALIINHLKSDHGWFSSVLVWSLTRISTWVAYCYSKVRLSPLQIRSGVSSIINLLTPGNVWPLGLRNHFLFYVIHPNSTVMGLLAIRLSNKLSVEKC